jgi:hypothetical protein
LVLFLIELYVPQTHTIQKKRYFNIVFQLPLTEVQYSQYLKLQLQLLQYSMVDFAAMSSLCVKEKKANEHTFIKHAKCESWKQFS